MTGRTDVAGWLSAHGHYAGSVSRLLAFIIDIAVSTGLFALGLAATSLAAQVVTGHSVSWSRTDIVVAVILVAWEFFYFGYSWAVSGRTFGMAVLGVRVVRADGMTLDPWRGAVRALAFPLSFLFLGLGFLGVLVQREHRALHDLIAGTAVIYAWDARAARIRFLARGDVPDSKLRSADHTRSEDSSNSEPLSPASYRRDSGASSPAAGEAVGAHSSDG